VRLAQHRQLLGGLLQRGLARLDEHPSTARITVRMVPSTGSSSAS
jgi:hypothetical protein